MVIDMFMEIDNTVGESKDSNHKGWTDITSFSWGASQPSHISVRGGGSAGKVNFNDLYIHSILDKSTPVILKHCASGKNLIKVEVSTCKASRIRTYYS